jgi:4-oxalomesaconate tautomerase
VHDAIGVFGAVSVATACLIPGTVASELADRSSGHDILDVEHPSGYFSVTLDVRVNGEDVDVKYAALMRTARLLMRGDVFIPSAVWPDA